MFKNHFGISIPHIENASMLVFWLIVINLGFNVLSNAAFRISALSPNWRGLLIWQVVGNLAGFVTVITLTWMLKYMPLSIAFPLTTGLTVLGVQMVAASWIFNVIQNSHLKHSGNFCRKGKAAIFFLARFTELNSPAAQFWRQELHR